MDTTSRSALATAGRVLAAVAASIAAAIHMLVWWIVAGLSCDDGCDELSSSWHDNPDAWQWSAMGWLAVASFLFALVFAIALATRRSALFTGAMAAAAAATAIAPWIVNTTG
jgi:uncharacterized membrane protein YphA (DoxX/SURF4 family)